MNTNNPFRLSATSAPNSGQLPSQITLPELQSTEPDKKIEFPQSTLTLARQNDKASLELMFRQFISQDESIHVCEYMGELGMLLGVTHSFACVTDRRISSLQVGHFGEVLYTDAMLEDVNSGAVIQPSNLWLYILAFGLVLSCLFYMYTLESIFPLLLLGFWPFVVKAYYRFVKCGLLASVKQGLWVYVFVNRGRLVRANALWRLCAVLRDERLAELRK
jgi:hypothetical protein